MKNMNIISVLIVFMLTPEVANAKDFMDRLADLAQDVGTRIIENEIDQAYRNNYASKINQLRVEASSTSYNKSEITALLNNIERLNNQNKRSQKRISELERMILQQNDVIVNKNRKETINGSEFIKSFYSLSKAVSLTESYSLLSNNAQQKLPFGDYSNWWGGTVKSVYVDKVTPLGNKKYKVNLSYYKKNGNYQCSEDIIYLLENNGGWLINDFTWGYCN